jgi:hypothetical protein
MNPIEETKEAITHRFHRPQQQEAQGDGDPANHLAHKIERGQFLLFVM